MRQSTTKQPHSATTASLNYEHTALPSGRVEFYSSKKRRESNAMERYQDCSWFGAPVLASSSAAEAQPQSELANNALGGETFAQWEPVTGNCPDDTSLLDKDYMFNQGDDSNYNINDYLIRKADSIDSIKNYSSVGLEQVIPISYKEKLHGERILKDIMVEGIKEEVYEDLNVAKEEVVCDEEKLYNDLWGEDDTEQLEAASPTDEVMESLPILDLSQELKKADLADLSFGLPVCFQVEEKKMVAQQEKGLKLDLGLAKSTFEEVSSINTPDLDFDLIDFINGNASNLTMATATTPTPCSSSSLPATVCEVAETKAQHQTYLAIPRKLTRTNENLPKMVMIDSALSTINLDHVRDATSIAERIKTATKRRRPARYEESEDEQEEDKESSDEDYEVEIDDSPKTKRRRTGEPSGGQDKYRELREKNNEASRRSRQNRKDKEKDLSKRLEDEERRNVELRARADELKKLVTSHRALLLQVLIRRGGG